MPAPQKAQLSQLAQTFFRANVLRLPESWSQPGDQYPDAFKPAEKATAPAPPPNLLSRVQLWGWRVLGGERSWPGQALIMCNLLNSI